MDKRHRVAIVDDHALMRRGIRLCLERRAAFSVVMEAANADEMYRLIPAANPEIVILDLVMPGDDGVTAIRKIRAQWPQIKIVVFTGSADHEVVGPALLAGADAFLRKENSPREFLRAVEAVVEGKSYLCADAATGLIDAFRNQSAPPELTHRESAVLKGIAEGRTYKEIAAALSIGAKSVETYRARLARKLGCASRAELVRYAVRARLVAE